MFDVYDCVFFRPVWPERDTIATDKGCPRCGAQIHLHVETLGPVRIADALERLLTVDLGDEMVLLATCEQELALQVRTLR